jgi:hypothetical protein
MFLFSSHREKRGSQRVTFVCLKWLIWGFCHPSEINDIKNGTAVILQMEKVRLREVLVSPQFQLAEVEAPGF